MAKVNFIANGKRVAFTTKPAGSSRKLSPFAKYVQKNGKSANQKASSPAAAMRAMAKAWRKKK